MRGRGMRGGREKDGSMQRLWWVHWGKQISHAHAIRMCTYTHKDMQTCMHTIHLIMPCSLTLHLHAHLPTLTL